MKRNQTYPWGEMEWLAGVDVGNATSVSVATMLVRPGEVSERHRHPNCDEAILVQRGQLLLELNGTTLRYDAGQCVVVPAGSAHRVQNVGSEDLFLVLSYGAGQRVYEAC
jgi:quercetin dioxygenase-like cupin family protein